MGDLRKKARQEAENQAVRDKQHWNGITGNLSAKPHHI